MYNTRIHENTISKFVPEVCTAIYKHLKGKYLRTPRTAEEWLKVAEDYEEKWNFPHCIGALDDRHITFSAPISSGSFYHNYKGTDSIVLLGLVDAHYRFIYINVGVNGRVSDGADEAFPLLANLLKPYPQRMSSYENRIFNYRLSRARRLVECGFGILANRWRVLLNKIHLGPEKVELITLTCVVLHNYLATENLRYTEGVDEFDMTLNQIVQQVGNHSSTSSREIREEFKNYFMSDIGSVPWQASAIQGGN
nr:unnamed protein product [Callosobruchus analis]